MKGNNFLLEEQLCFSTYTLSKQFTKLYRPVLEPYALTYTQYVALLVLWEKSDLSVQSLGTKLGLDSGTLTPMLKRMESNGFITRKRHPEDERRVIIATTPKADNLKDELLKKVSACLALLNLNEQDYFDLLEKMNQLTKTLGGINND
ncbi:transcriptional regulator, MarR family [Carnobacterium alterfunditum]|uniref:HTH-type transcriptional regulator SarZ n=1 Tax=Carnobacterium alterfunditum TaxID=28230 RepID=A0A1N6I3B1_9LACT|nr:MarR family transcriptional regulator [Carnobacterium alterfunditum]SIO26518.1 transcriptional regulator, MarR family [Carnobacterium alterfunditum]